MRFFYNHSYRNSVSCSMMMKSGEIPKPERIQPMVGLPLCHKIATTDRTMLSPHGSVRGEQKVVLHLKFLNKIFQTR